VIGTLKSFREKNVAYILDIIGKLWAECLSLFAEDDNGFYRSKQVKVVAAMTACLYESGLLPLKGSPDTLLSPEALLSEAQAAFHKANNIIGSGESPGSHMRITWPNMRGHHEFELPTQIEIEEGLRGEIGWSHDHHDRSLLLEKQAKESGLIHFVSHHHINDPEEETGDNRE